MVQIKPNLPLSLFNKSVFPLLLIAVLFSCKAKDKKYTTWSVYWGDKESRSYSAFYQVNKSNLDQLEVAWIYHTGDAREGNRSTIECNPIIVNYLMYLITSGLKF